MSATICSRTTLLGRADGASRREVLAGATHPDDVVLNLSDIHAGLGSDLGLGGALRQRRRTSAKRSADAWLVIIRRYGQAFIDRWRQG